MSLTLSEISGEWYSLLAAILWSFSTLIYRVYAIGVSSAQLNLFKGVTSLFFFFVSIFMLGGFTPIGDQFYALLALSGVVGISIGDSAFFAGMSRIGGALTSAIQSLAPPLTAILGFFLLSELLTFRQILGLLIVSGSVAILVLSERKKIAITADDPAVFKKGVLFALLAAVCQAIGVIMSRKPLEVIPAIEGGAHRLFIAMAALYAFNVWHAGQGVLAPARILLRLNHRFPLLLASFIGTFLGLIFMVQGLKTASSGVAIAISSSYPIWLAVWEWLFFRRWIGVLGLGCLFASLLGLFYLLG